MFLLPLLVLRWYSWTVCYSSGTYILISRNIKLNFGIYNVFTNFFFSRIIYHRREFLIIFLWYYAVLFFIVTIVGNSLISRKIFHYLKKIFIILFRIVRISGFGHDTEWNKHVNCLCFVEIFRKWYTRSSIWGKYLFWIMHPTN